jgi:hypothetical protein
MIWFQIRGISKGQPESIKDDYSGTQLKRILIRRESICEDSSQLRVRRIKRQLTIVM